MSDNKRSRRSSADLLPILKMRKNTFANFAYAGSREIMIRVFEEELKDRDIPSKVIETYFSKIPAPAFADEDTIRNYGKNICSLREGRGFTQEKVAEVIGLEGDHDAISKIENGSLKKINRNFLVLLCGLFQTSPEYLMGLEERNTQPMVFDPVDITGKPQFIVNQLAEQSPELVHILSKLACMPRKKQEKFLRFLQCTPRIELLNTQEMSELIKSNSGKKLADINKNTFGDKWIEYINIFGDLGSSNIDLLNMYVSIAAMDQSNYSTILSLLDCAGYLIFDERNLD